MCADVALYLSMLLPERRSRWVQVHDVVFATGTRAIAFIKIPSGFILTISALHMTLCGYHVHLLSSHQVGDYWGWFGKRSYHHTGPVSTFYAMREAMAVVAEEGLENMWWVVWSSSFCKEWDNFRRHTVCQFDG